MYVYIPTSALAVAAGGAVAAGAAAGTVGAGAIIASAIGVVGVVGAGVGIGVGVAIGRKIEKRSQAKQTQGAEAAQRPDGRRSRPPPVTHPPRVCLDSFLHMQLVANETETVCGNELVLLI